MNQGFLTRIINTRIIDLVTMILVHLLGRLGLIKIIRNLNQTLRNHNTTTYRIKDKDKIIKEMTM